MAVRICSVIQLLPFQVQTELQDAFQFNRWNTYLQAIKTFNAAHVDLEDRYNGLKWVNDRTCSELEQAKKEIKQLKKELKS